MQVHPAPLPREERCQPSQPPPLNIAVPSAHNLLTFQGILPSSVQAPSTVEGSEPSGVQRSGLSGVYRVDYQVGAALQPQSGWTEGSCKVLCVVC